MSVLLYLAVVIAVLYWVVKILAPEMAKPPVQPPMPKPVSDRGSFEITQEKETDNRIEKVESLLVEKNKNIQLLQTELKIFHAQISNFNKVKILFEEEIHRLREQNRIFRSELGLPTVQTKENSLT